ncbi:MAG: hypothetical protein Q4P24_16775, partial [Rhodobacterales bacterium]|nr:hypothetical protein [Rhodobacterales bacterium]
TCSAKGNATTSSRPLDTENYVFPDVSSEDDFPIFCGDFRAAEFFNRIGGMRTFSASANLSLRNVES